MSRVVGAAANWVARKGRLVVDDWAAQRATAWAASLAGWLVVGSGRWTAVWTAPKIFVEWDDRSAAMLALQTDAEKAGQWVEVRVSPQAFSMGNSTVGHVVAL